MKRQIKMTLIMLMLATLPAGASASIEVGGVQFASTVDAQDGRLHLQGAGILTYMVFIKAYAGALYLPESAQPHQALEPVAKHLELEYYHPIKGEDFASATRIKILDNIPADQVAELRARIDMLSEMYRDVTPGDRYALSYFPGRGTVLSLNGQALGTIFGDDFARAVFAMWLGDNPIDRGFRDRLLGTS